jgi:glycerol-3-phosphate O-acyltransferase
MAYMIESHIPVPLNAGKKTGAPSKGYDKLLQRMNVGDSVAISRKSLPSMFNHAKKLNIKIVTRKIDQHTRRLWVVEKEG